MIPDSGETRREVLINDYDRLRHQLGIDPPTDPADPAQKDAYLHALAASFARITPSFLSGLDAYARLTTIERYLGYRRVDQDITALCLGRRLRAKPGAAIVAACL